MGDERSLCQGMLSPTLEHSREKCSMITVKSEPLVFSCQSSLSWHHGSQLVRSTGMAEFLDGD